MSLHRTWAPRLLTAAFVATALAGAARAEEETTVEPSPATSEMLKSMREKGILSEEEYEDIYRRQAKYEENQRAKDALPGWLQDWTFGGDLRIRVDHETFHGQEVGPNVPLEPGKDNVDVVNGTASSQRTRTQLRLRIGAEKRLGDDFTLGFRIATSQATAFGTNSNQIPGATAFPTMGQTTLSNPRSANVDLGDYFSYKSIFLDRAYVRWSPAFAETLSVVLGKFGNPFVSKNFSGDFLVWDQDIQPEGIAFNWRFEAWPEKVWLDTVGGVFVISNVNGVTVDTTLSGTNTTTTTPPQMDDRTPYMYAVQEGLTVEPVEWLRAGIRGSYYDLQNLDQRFSAAVQEFGNGGGAISKNPIFFFLGPTSTYFESGESQGRMQEAVGDVYMSFSPFGDMWRVTPYFQYMGTLSGIESQNHGYGIGVDLGSSEFLKLSFLYAMIQRNGTISIFTDSDMFDGFTNARGIYVAAERQLTRSLRMRVAYFKSKEAQPGCAAEDKYPTLFCETAALNPFLADFRKTSLDRWRLQVDMTVDF